MKNVIHIQTDELKNQLPFLEIGQTVLLSGKVYTARDAAHKKLAQMVSNNQPLPFEINQSIIYYTGPTPTPPKMVIGSCGPTTAYRMEKYLPQLLKQGLLGTIGKGKISENSQMLMKKYKAVYFMAIGGAGALSCKYVTDVKEVAFKSLGCESVKELTICEFPLIVGI